ncbi:MAG: hypothetical protein F6J87_08575 [Spirulina sp. SIO3F2]|nr:hypothetical protein [Spirulina sp. SIO3F2]
MSKVWGIFQYQATGENTVTVYCLIKVDLVEQLENEAQLDLHRDCSHLYFEAEGQKYFDEFFHIDLSDDEWTEQVEEQFVRIEKHYTFSTVKQRILEYCQGQLWQSMENPGKYEISYGTVVLENRWGQLIRVGVSKYGWLFLSEDDEKYDMLQEYFSQVNEPDDPNELVPQGGSSKCRVQSSKCLYDRYRVDFE